jgi:hypothetical protein
MLRGETIHFRKPQVLVAPATMDAAIAIAANLKASPARRSNSSQTPAGSAQSLPGNRRQRSTSESRGRGRGGPHSRSAGGRERRWWSLCSGRLAKAKSSASVVCFVLQDRLGPVLFAALKAIQKVPPKILALYDRMESR